MATAWQLTSSCCSASRSPRRSTMGAEAKPPASKSRQAAPSLHPRITPSPPGSGSAHDVRSPTLGFSRLRRPAGGRWVVLRAPDLDSPRSGRAPQGARSICDLRIAGSCKSFLEARDSFCSVEDLLAPLNWQEYGCCQVNRLMANKRAKPWRERISWAISKFPVIRAVCLSVVIAQLQGSAYGHVGGRAGRGNTSFIHLPLARFFLAERPS